MSAICGILGCRPGADSDVGAMLDALADYGAGRAEWSDGPVSLGRRCRLDAGGSALPEQPASAQQPGAIQLHRCREAGLTLAADARLDDREALRGALSCREADVADGELILRAYRRWGRDCPSHLLGDYAFALWDARRHTLFCARDHIGAKPFYYARTGERFVFASAVPAVLAAPGVSGQLDEAFVAAHLTRIASSSTTRTFFAAVRKLPPGHALTATREGRLRVERHWRPENAPRARPTSDDACAEECLDLCTKAVRDRLRGAGPVATHLSGGLDSSGVSALAARELRRQGQAPPLAFTWLPALGGRTPKAEHAPEYALVDAVGQQEELRTLYCAPSSDDMLAVLRRDGALPDMAQAHLNEEAVQRRAEEMGVRVLLSGWGGDEGVSFNGFRGYPEQLLITGRWLRLLAHARSRRDRPLKYLARIALLLAHPHLHRAVSRWRRGKEPDRRRWLIAPAFRREVKPLRLGTFREVGARRTQLRLLRDGHLSKRMEGWAASGARRGIEYRYPLLDRRLLEFVLGLPPEQFRHDKRGRWLMHRAFDPVLPEVCWNQVKTDPARVEALIDAFAEALPTVRREIAARAAPPPRARYVDMSRLLERLDADRFRADPQLSPVLNALQLLDFQIQPEGCGGNSGGEPV